MGIHNDILHKPNSMLTMEFMEIRDPVHGTISILKQEVQIIDSQEFQRLRSIKQLGFAEFSFPGATHNRYIHSIGVCHLAGQAFDCIFDKFTFSSKSTRRRLRQTLRLAALLHDIGHGPLSHTTEEVMPSLSELKLKIYQQKNKKENPDRKATHEDYTMKYLTDSPLAELLRQEFSDLTPNYVACLIDKSIQAADDFFVDQGLNFRPILSQLVSSELDVDRMDYLERDSYFCGTNYGKIDLPWLLRNLTFHIHEGSVFLSVSRRALYTFDDFLLSRHHMYLMVYFHHKSIIYEEMLLRYLTSKDCTFNLPASIQEYTAFNDHKLYENLAHSQNEWAQRISQRKPLKVLLELHNNQQANQIEKLKKALEKQHIPTIWSSSSARLSKYHTTSPEDRSSLIYVVDSYDRWNPPQPINQSTQIFEKYEGTRIIDRLYVSSENLEKGLQILDNHAEL